MAQNRMITETDRDATTTRGTLAALDPRDADGLIYELRGADAALSLTRAQKRGVPVHLEERADHAVAALMAALTGRSGRG